MVGLLAETFGIAGHVMPTPAARQPDMASGPNVTVNPKLLGDVNAIHENMRTAEQKIPVNQVAQMSAPGIKAGLRPIEGSTLQVAEHNKADMDHLPKPNGPFGASA